MDATSFIALVAACAPLVDAGTAQALVSVESAFNPHAIGVVQGVLERQPRSHAEALATAKSLEASGWNYSVGLAQINAKNFARLGLSPDTAFEPCANLRAMEAILLECFERARKGGANPQSALRQSFSCYYSGNFVTGFRDGYVAKVVRSARPSAGRPTPTPHLAKEPS